MAILQPEFTIKNIRIGYLHASAFLLLFLASLFSKGRETALLNAEVCVYSNSEAGYTAPIQAARMGKQVFLVEISGHPGGMMVEGIAKDIRFGGAKVISGITCETYTNVEAFYGRKPACDSLGWSARYEPHVAEKEIEKLLAREKNIRVLRKRRITEHHSRRDNPHLPLLKLYGLWSYPDPAYLSDAWAGRGRSRCSGRGATNKGASD